MDYIAKWLSWNENIPFVVIIGSFFSQSHSCCSSFLSRLISPEFLIIPFLNGEENPKCVHPYTPIRLNDVSNWSCWRNRECTSHYGRISHEPEANNLITMTRNWEPCDCPDLLCFSLHRARFSREETQPATVICHSCLVANATLTASAVPVLLQWKLNIILTRQLPFFMSTFLCYRAPSSLRSTQWFPSAWLKRNLIHGTHFLTRSGFIHVFGPGMVRE